VRLDIGRGGNADAATIEFDALLELLVAAPKRAENFVFSARDLDKLRFELRWTRQFVTSQPTTQDPLI
jgi:hypothetical protein